MISASKCQSQNYKALKDITDIFTTFWQRVISSPPTLTRFLLLHKQKFKKQNKNPQRTPNEKINKVDLIKIRNISSTKHTREEKIIATYN